MQTPTSDDSLDGPVTGGPGLTVAAVARRLGVSPTTLRTWDRRYDLGPVRHAPGTHRRYRETDVERLLVMRRLVYDGVTAADAAAVARRSTGGHATPKRVPRPGRGGGGRVLALPRAGAAARGLSSSALALDAAKVVELLRRSIADRGLDETWHEVVLPVLDAVGRHWAASGEGVEVEHLLADCVVAVLRPMTIAPGPTPGRPVLLAGAEGDLHALPLYVVAAALAERRVPCRILGPNVPYSALAAAVARSGPSAVFVWAQIDQYGDSTPLTQLPRTRPATRIVAGGPGWRVRTGDEVQFVDNFDAAMCAVADGLGGAR